MSSSLTNWLLLLDSNAPWVRSLFSVLPGVSERRRRVLAWRIHTPLHLLTSILHPRREAPSRLSESTIPVPGWTRFQRLSTLLLTRAVRRAIARHGPPQAIVYTLPQYAAVAETFARHRQAYYAYDPYRFYTGWDPHRVDALETRMLNTVSLTFAVSRQLVADLQPRTRTPVFYSPNAVSADFVGKLRSDTLPTPPDLANVRTKIIGCIGHLDPVAHDWNLIDALSSAFPQATFVFIGDFSRDRTPATARALDILRRPNIRWLGPRPHSQLPAYLRRFDVCLNPLAVTPHNHRRSLLRLYDYLATDKPILSTAVAEALEFADLLEIGNHAEDLALKLGKMLTAPQAPNLELRRNYIVQNTWEHRASSLCNRLLTTASSSACSCSYSCSCS